MERDNFIFWAEKRRFYQHCLVDVYDWICTHSDAIKYHKLNNTKGIKLIIKEMLDNLDKFIEEGSSLEVTINDK